MSYSPGLLPLSAVVDTVRMDARVGQISTNNSYIQISYAPPVQKLESSGILAYATIAL